MTGGILSAKDNKKQPRRRKVSKKEQSMKKIAVICYGLSLLFGTLIMGGGSTAHADNTPPPTPTPPAATVEQRVADLEAYVNNGSPGTDGKVTWTTNLSGSGPGHNGWMMISTAIVLMMTLPGLALFYGGMVRKKNILSVMAQCFGITGLVSILWWVIGYSLTFGHGSPFIGYANFAFFKGVTSIPNADYSTWVSQNVYAMFQLTFAIITPMLIFGSVAERIKFKAVILFVALWMLLVYFPLAHMVWGADGLMNGVFNAKAMIHAADFAGGTVVHMTSGWSAIVLCFLVGKRLGHGKEHMPPHSVVMTMIGTGLLWVGWYGFNAGSAGAADVISANAFTTTTLATAFASFVWAMWEYALKKKASVLGFCSGAISGLVVITPACGFVDTSGAAIIGLIAGTIPFFMVTYVKPMFGYDDALDVFGVHAIGGTVGAIVTGILATPTVNANLNANLADYIKNHTLWIEQVKAVGVTIVLAMVGTLIIGFIVEKTVGLRPTAEEELQGLDLSEHGEEGYIY